MKGGYETREYWSEEGWNWKSFKEAKHPIFWVCPYKCKSGSGSSLSSLSNCENQFNEVEKTLFDQNTKRIESTELDENFKQNFFGYKFALFFYTINYYFKINLFYLIRLRLIFDVIPMPANWPVEVNYHEAKAFCKWKGSDYRLLSEAEHHAIRDNDATENIPHKCNNNMSFGSSTVSLIC